MAIKKFKNGNLLDSNSIYYGSWTTLILNTGINVGSLCGIPSYKKVGNRVSIRGGITFTAAGTDTIVVSVLPKNLRPPESIYKITSLSGTRVARIGVSSGGNVFIDWVYNMNGTPYSGNVPWLDLSIDFWLD